MSLFLKYRPQTFSDLVGQDNVRKTLQNALKSSNPSHAYLFTGSRGTGKTSTARIFAKGLNCQNLNAGDPCGTCDFCVDTANGSLVDVIEIDAASNRGIDEIRDLREKINFAPNRAKRKVYIIDEVHMLTKEAFNALLKTLEEPPEHAFFCLATTELHKVPETIISRCQVFSFQRFTLDQLNSRLNKICDQEGFKTDQESLALISRKAEGGLRDAISSLEQVAAECENNLTEEVVRVSLGISKTETLENFYQNILNSQTQEALDILKLVAQNGQDFRTFGHDLLTFLREIMFQKVNAPEVHQIIQIIDEIEIALQRIKTSPIVELPLEIAVIKLTNNQVFVPTANTAQNTAQANKTPQVTKLAPVIEKPKPVAKPTPAPQVAPVQNNNVPDDGFVFDDAALNTQNVTPAPSPVQTTETNVSTGNSGDIKSQMNAIAEKSGIPIFAKKSFLSTKPEQQGNMVVFYADSDFHKEKLVDASTKIAIKNAFQEVTGLNLDIEFQKRGEKPLVSNSTQTNQSNTPVSTPKAIPQETVSVDDFLNF